MNERLCTLYVLRMQRGCSARRRSYFLSTTHEDREREFLPCTQFNSSRLDSIRAASTFSLMKTLLCFSLVVQHTLLYAFYAAVRRAWNERALCACAHTGWVRGHSAWYFNWIRRLFNWGLKLTPIRSRIVAYRVDVRIG